MKLFNKKAPTVICGADDERKMINKKIDWMFEGFNFIEYHRLLERLIELSKNDEWFKMRYEIFKVNGAGDIAISKSGKHSTAFEIGFSISTSWGSHPFTGGVIPLDEAVRMANHILEYAKLVSEEDVIAERKRGEEMRNKYPEYIKLK